ncbi:hypothetical protein CcaverHIS002_0410960 [Cutaneotrichosporon cavernicola]|nr:hypothetical protein CcaverHIS002_0410960 [Cutaneotrichosporon cavernicola]
MTISDISRYPDPMSTVRRKLRTDGDRVQGKWDLGDMQIEGNEGGIIPTDHLGWLPSLPADAPIEDIRAAYERDGVVHLRGLLPIEQVMAVRRQFFESVQHTGVLKEGTEPVEGIYSGLGAQDPSIAREHRLESDDLLLNHRTQANHEKYLCDFADHPLIMEMATRIKSGWKKPFRFRMQLLRTNIPHAYRCATRVHYDQMYLRGMEPDALTAWVPIGDITPLGGGLMYLEDSVTIGEEIENGFIEWNKDLPDDEQIDAFNINMLEGGGLTRDCRAFAEQTRRRWLIANYQAGDVVFHHCTMVHCSANNEDPDERIRFATDVRFADKEAAFEARWW